MRISGPDSVIHPCFAEGDGEPARQAYGGGGVEGHLAAAPQHRSVGGGADVIVGVADPQGGLGLPHPRAGIGGGASHHPDLGRGLYVPQNEDQAGRVVEAGGGQPLG